MLASAVIIEAADTALKKVVTSTTLTQYNESFFITLSFFITGNQAAGIPRAR
jgi:hypothetical protein